MATHSFLPRRWLRTAIVLGATVLPWGAGAAADVNRPTHSTPLPPPRDGNIAVAEELQAARRAGTIAAYDLFLARHPTHKLARTARSERARLRRGRPAR